MGTLLLYSLIAGLFSLMGGVFLLLLGTKVRQAITTSLLSVCRRRIHRDKLYRPHS